MSLFHLAPSPPVAQRRAEDKKHDDASHTILDADLEKSPQDEKFPDGLDLSDIDERKLVRKIDLRSVPLSLRARDRKRVVNPGNSTG